MFDQILGGVPTPLKFVIAFAVVILLIVIAAWAVKRIGGRSLARNAASGRSRQPRLGVLDVLAVDGRRRLVIVRRDNVEHLVMIGGPNDLVVESGILRTPTGVAGQREALPVAPPDPAPARPAPPPQPTPAAPRVAPPPASAAAAERGPERAPPAGRPVEPLKAGGPRAVEAPPLAASRDPVRPQAPARQPAPQGPTPQVQGPGLPTSPVQAPPIQAPSVQSPKAEPRPAPPVQAPQPAAETAPQPSIAPAQQPLVPQQRPAPPARPIIAGPGRAGAPEARPGDIAERLAAALKRPVTAASRPPAAERAAQAPEPFAETAPPKPEPAAPKAPPPAAPSPLAQPKPQAPEVSIPEVKAPPPAQPKPVAPQVKAAPVDDAEPPREMPAMGGGQPARPAAATAPVAAPASPDVRAEPKPAPAPVKAEEDDDPLASLEAEMASLLGRDVGQTKP